MTEIIPYSDDYLDYMRDESRHSGWAESICFPRSEAELREAVAQTAATDTPLYIQGGRTGLAAGAVPQGGCVLNLSRMDRVLAARERDGRFTLTVQPGLLLTELRRQLAAKRIELNPEDGQPDEESLRAAELLSHAPEQFFSPDPTETTAALGGMAACNSSGARTFCYGPTRPHICGLHLVLADGDLLVLHRGESFAKKRHLSLTTEQGRHLEIELPTYQMPRCKNASGYYVADDMDAIDLIIGSDGTLGVISELTVSLLPLPSAICGLTCYLPTEAQALQLVRKAREQVPDLAAIEYFDHGALALLTARQQKGELPDIPPRPQNTREAVFFELHCTDKDQLRQRIGQLAALLTEVGADTRQTWVGWNVSQLARLHAFRHAIPESANLVIDERKHQYPSLSKCSADMAVPDAYLEQVVAMYRRDLAAEDLQVAIWGHIGNNHLHVGVLPRDPEEQTRARKMQEGWAAQVSKWQGAVSAEHGIGKSKRSLLTIMYGAEQVAAMEAVKRVFDPTGRLSPGNLFPPRPTK